MSWCFRQNCDLFGHPPSELMQHCAMSMIFYFKSLTPKPTEWGVDDRDPLKQFNIKINGSNPLRHPSVLYSVASHIFTVYTEQSPLYYLDKTKEVDSRDLEGSFNFSYFTQDDLHVSLFQDALAFANVEEIQIITDELLKRIKYFYERQGWVPSLELFKSRFISFNLAGWQNPDVQMSGYEYRMLGVLKYYWGDDGKLFDRSRAINITFGTVPDIFTRFLRLLRAPALAQVGRALGTRSNAGKALLSAAQGPRQGKNQRPEGGKRRKSKRKSKRKTKRKLSKKQRKSTRKNNKRKNNKRKTNKRKTNKTKNKRKSRRRTRRA